MTTTDDKTPPSLPDVLEQEYQLVHGALPKDYPSCASEAVRIREMTKQIHSLQHKRTAICFSGGGIRSATFGLGVLRSLARLRLLDKFDFLSTVSGGGYIGSWLTAWIHRHPRGLAGVVDELSAVPHARSEHEPDPVRWLRNYSNYLSPRLGFLSADSWTLAGTYLRNLLLNWLVLLPLLIVPLLAPRVLIALTQMNAADVPDRGLTIFITAGLGFGAMALIYLHLFRPNLQEFRTNNSWKLLETQAWFLKAGLAPLLLSTFCLTVSWAWFRNSGGSLDQFTLSTSVLSAMLIHLGCWLFTCIVLRRVRNLGRWMLLEVLVIGSTGALGGFFVWTVLAETPFQITVAQYAEWYAGFAIPGFLAMFLLTATIFIGVASRFTDDHDREWWGRAGSWVLIAMVSWAVLSSVVIFGPGLVAAMPKLVTSLGGISGLVSLFWGFGKKTPAGPDMERNWLNILTEGATKTAAPIFMLFILTLLTLGTSWLLDLTAHLHGYHLNDPAAPDTIGLQMPPDPWGHAQILHHTPLWILIEVGLAMAGFGVGMGFFININKFSLHAMYRNRLIRAYLGASRPRKEREREFNPFTGFDNNDNAPICDFQFDDVRLVRALYQDHVSEPTRLLLAQSRSDAAPDLHQLQAVLDEEIRNLVEQGTLARVGDDLALGPACMERLRALSKTKPGVPLSPRLLAWLRSLFINALYALPPRPLHVLNIALNLVKGDNLAWQQRKAQSFTMSPLHCGGWNLGYRASQDYGTNMFLHRAISLGTALAISGAAASPNMGYHSSPAVTFLLALFNVRLGWWLGNPGPAGATTYRRASPVFAVGPLVSEVFGLTNTDHPYVYLSDGGHFENLGLYEMVLRRCHSILVVDAGCDPAGMFEDLGNAIRKIRIDLGIDIEIDLDMLRQQAGSSLSRWHHAIGTIRYDRVDATATVGTLLYIKSSLTGDEPSDVHEYASGHPAFPHEPTSDQFFDESQFESYNRLGEHIAWGVLRPAMHRADEGFVAVCDELRSHWTAVPPAMQESFTRDQPAWTQLEQLLRSDPNLIEYDVQVYPELQSLFGHPPGQSSTLDRRSALHACNLQLQLMEKMYFSLNLGELHGHPLSRGWMNLFRRWSATSTLREFWPILRGGHSRQFVDFVHRHLNLGFPPAFKIQPCTDLEFISTALDQLTREWSENPDFAATCRTAFQQPVSLDSDQTASGRPARWHLCIPPSSPDEDGARGQLLAIAVATRLSARELGLFGWVWPHYRGQGAGTQLFTAALSSLRPAYSGYTVVTDVGRDDPSVTGYHFQKADWLRFCERLGFMRDRSTPDRLRMMKTLE